MKNNILRSSILILLPTGLLFFLVTQWQTINEEFGFESNYEIVTQSNNFKNRNTCQSKHRGAHVFGRIDTTNTQFLTRNNVEWVTLVAWANQKQYNSRILGHHNGDSLDIAKSDSNWVQRIKEVRRAGFKVFVKPHIWLNTSPEGKWRSEIFPENEENWFIWKKSYRGFILRYAQIAEKANAEMFCVGTELSTLAVKKPTFWTELIQDVRAAYSGEVTYAANWHNEYEKISFWDDLDYIGIQAYFPLVKNKNPTVSQISKGWKKYLPEIESIHKKYKRKILFTEMGYKSTTDSAIKPWEWIDNPSSKDKSYSCETQANCYRAFFNTIWQKEWFAGAHLWFLRSDYQAKDSINYSMDFMPEGKPGEQIIAKGFKKNKKR